MTLQPVHQADFAAALTDPSRPVPNGVVSYRGDADARRFAVYRNNVHVGLVGVLASKFPVCAKLVGDDFFTAMARVYVADHKPASPVMMQYGHDFPAFVAQFAGARTVPYLADIADLEEAWSRAYNAADATAAALTDLVALGPEALLGMVIEPHPAARLVRSPFPVGSIWSAHQAEGVEMQAGAQAVLVTRPLLEVGVTVIPGVDAVFVEQLFAGVPIGIAAEGVLETDPQFDFGGVLAGLCALGAFSPPTPIQGGIHGQVS
ncbi:MAG TPA: DNA-binding domain-containing protein [Devosia sp.]|jgi:hypothetical protein|nr:DNA-binding domain-containing protein [Devosia sp.]